MTDQDDPLIRIIAVLKEPVALAPDLTARVMAELERVPSPGPVAAPPLVAWWRRRWTIRVSPVGALAMAAGLVAVVVAGQRFGRRAETPSLGQTQFVLVARDAKAVALVGDFNDWSLSATPLERTDSDGVWWVTVPLVPGRYRYAYVVDGTMWRPDPQAPAAEDEFGRPNSVVTIGGT